jgi:hypothetical protein
MSAGDTRSDAHWVMQTRPYWLPPNGTGNGISARAWAPIADLTEAEAFAMLTSCARAGIAAFVAPRDGGRPQARPPIYRARVDSEHFGAAEDALRHAVNEVRDLNQARP